MDLHPQNGYLWLKLTFLIISVQNFMLICKFEFWRLVQPSKKEFLVQALELENSLDGI